MKGSTFTRNVVICLCIVSALSVLVIFDLSWKLAAINNYAIERIGSAPMFEPPELLKGVRKIVCIGDSITLSGGVQYGYVDQLRGYLKALYPQCTFEVVNEGVNGETSSELAERFGKVVSRNRPDLIVVMIGVNDLKQLTEEQVRGDDSGDELVDSYEESMQKVFSEAEKAKLRMVVMSPAIAMENPDNRLNRLLDKFTSKLKDLADERKVAFADLHHPFASLISDYKKSTKSPELYLTIDGVHPNGSGHHVIVNCLLTALGVSNESRSAVRPVM